MIRPRRLLLAIALLLVSSAGARTEQTGTVKGTVTTGPDRQVVADAVVMIEGPANSGGTTRATMNQQHEAFAPHVLGVAVGTTVDFPNGDPVLHNVFSTSPAKRFDLGMYGQGETRTVVFDSPGVVLVRCNVHPRMTGYIVVHSNPYVTVTDAHGCRCGSDAVCGTDQVCNDSGYCSARPCKTDDDCDCGVCVNTPSGTCASDFYFCSMLAA